MLELHQFRHSAFCLKVRMALAAKNLTYRTIAVTPGIGQLELFKLSGQRQVPVLVDGDHVIADSSAIIRHLDSIQPEPKLIPSDSQQSALVHLIEDWADTTLASAARSALIQAVGFDKELRENLIAKDLPESFKQVINQVPYGFFNGIKEITNKGERSELIISLEKLSKLLGTHSWLIGNKMSAADISVAAQLSLVKFPSSSGIPLEGKGCPGIKDSPNLRELFNWRDQLEKLLFHGDQTKNDAS